jgi:hypothetical protein
MVVIVSDHYILIRIVPEQWVSSNLNHLVLRRSGVLLRTIAEPFEVVQADRDHTTSLRVLNFEVSLVEAVLQPVVAIELANQVSLGVNECKFLGVSGEIHFGDVELKLLLFLSLF